MNTLSLDQAVDQHIYSDVSAQVRRELEAQSFVADDIAEAITRCGDDDRDEITVYQWWTVSERFATVAANTDEVIVKTPFGIVWGRQTCGQAIAQDPNVQDIFNAMDGI
ncbi:hypothetical protein [Desulfopila aestuarii]|uniref:Uncharacterized protein n=1 Tax=Desulfopila aestuarii DSM 18488 TaxID=1121416 RepID=A0A1M7YK18_9BACT|nr:hypothetical protein [Desulfopila aestuarii]SHO52975.1 hypothetical protein SAMN02745220_04864 [Desulfopila aestuarii DSM 18488]